jgi:hypothetical protein
MLPVLLVTPDDPSVISRPVMVKLAALAALRLIPVALEFPNANVGEAEERVNTPVCVRFPEDRGVTLTFPRERTLPRAMFPL